jgi:hypothetical protein
MVFTSNLYLGIYKYSHTGSTPVASTLRSQRSKSEGCHAGVGDSRVGGPERRCETTAWQASRLKFTRVSLRLHSQKRGCARAPRHRHDIRSDTTPRRTQLGQGLAHLQIQALDY